MAVFSWKIFLRAIVLCVNRTGEYNILFPILAFRNLMLFVRCTLAINTSN